ncbi:MAG: hypothetical protein V1262_13895, partial [Alphaproteobacteria bacterium]|nr:hypothetical protein [Alphaproteobacteria bacterium]
AVSSLPHSQAHNLKVVGSNPIPGTSRSASEVLLAAQDLSTKSESLKQSIGTFLRVAKAA